jgi:uncharacterized protein (DUF58 family)
MGTAAELAEILAEVRRIEVLGRRKAVREMAGGYASAFRGAGIEFDDVREYAEGDDPRTVDWNVTARAGRPFVRRYVDERERTLLFLADLSPSMGGGFGPWSARQVAARVLASVALTAARHHDRVGFLGFGRGVLSWVPPRKGKAHCLRIVRDCLAMPAGGGGTDPAAALEFAARAARRHAVVLVLSDFLAGGWREPMARCARRHDVVAVRITVPEIALPPSGLVRALDPETGRETVIDAGSPAVRAAWSAAVAAHRERTERDLRACGVDLVEVEVPRTRDRDAVTGPLLRFFRMRERRGAKR